MTSLTTNMQGINVCEVNPAHQLWAFGGENGVVEFWDPRSRNRLVSLNVAQTLLKTVGDVYMNGRSKVEISSLKFANDGLSLGVGTSSGHVLLFDLRNDYPTVTKDHQYGFPIKNILFHSSGNVLSADQKIIKIWEKNSGDMFTSIEPPHDINDVCTFGDDTGLVMVANEGSQIQTFYVPQLGPSPKWCSFLDNLTEEMEENPNTTFYDDYKFVSRKELQALNLDHLIGTNLLRAYMHGYFVDLRLYEKAKAIANPFAYDDYKRQQVEKKLEQERATRISAKRKLPKINKRLAEKMLQESTDADATQEGTLFKDSRFGELFTNPDFQVDESTHEYRLRHPNEAKKNQINRFEKVDDESESEYSSESDASPMEDSDDDVFGRESRDEEPRRTKPVKKVDLKPSKSAKPQTAKQPAFYEIKVCIAFFVRYVFLSGSTANFYHPFLFLFFSTEQNLDQHTPRQQRNHLATAFKQKTFKTTICDLAEIGRVICR
jgi:ribosome biogenesis protein ENP2